MPQFPRNDQPPSQPPTLHLGPGPEHPEPGPALAPFPVRPGELSKGEQQSLVRADQDRRWRWGDRARVEDYLRHLPDLQADPEAVLDLIYGEVILREEHGDAPQLEEYLERFPGHATQLRRQFSVHRALRAAAGDTPRLPAAGAGPGPGEVEPPRIPGYEILGVLGRGGMGTVYKARQLSLNRPVALKMVRAGRYAGPEDLVRFRVEAEALASLQHPNVVQIHEAGHQDGRPYFAMELIDGPSLARKLEAGPLATREAAQLVQTLARAMHYAHEHKIVHRDLKPANVLLTEGGVPKITDFGLAKRLDHNSGPTRCGEVLGTPCYMAPEQALGQLEDIGPATDVYALGAILYEALTGRPPFAPRSWPEAVQQIKHESPPPPSDWQPRVTRDLETICLKCLEKEPERRYGGAQALAEDLQAFLAGEPLRYGRPATVFERAVNWVRRRPRTSVFLGVGGAAVLGLLGGSLVYSPLTVGALTVLGLLGGAGWYSARLQRALRELKEQQLLSQRGGERLHLLLETTQRLMTVPDLDALLRLIAQTTATLANAERASIFLIARDRGELWSRVALGSAQAIHLPLGVGIVGTVAVTGETINLPDAYADERFNPAVDRASGYKTRNLLAFPMKASDGRVLGVFQVLNKRQGHFDAEDARLLWFLASSSALALENPHRYPPAPAGAPPESGPGGR